MIKYPISVGNYVSTWGTWEMCREIIQNAMDASELDFDISYADGRLIVKNEGIIDTSCLVLGNGTKGVDSRERGAFGEGLKLAFLVALRLGREITVHTGNALWKPSIIHDDRLGDLMGVDILEACGRSAATTVSVEITPSEWELINERILDDGLTSRVLDRDETGNIYVGGLWVCEMDGFTHSFNFAPSAITLNRDRDIPSYYDIQREATKLLSVRESFLSMCERQAPEIDRYSVDAEVLADSWDHIYPDTMPVAQSEQGNIVAAHGMPTRVVPQWMAALIRGVRDYLFSRKGTPLERLERFAANVYLSQSDRDELESIIASFKKQ